MIDRIQVGGLRLRLRWLAGLRVDMRLLRHLRLPQSSVNGRRKPKKAIPGERGSKLGNSSIVMRRYFRYVGKDQSGRQRGGLMRLVQLGSQIGDGNGYRSRAAKQQSALGTRRASVLQS